MIAALAGPVWSERAGRAAQLLSGGAESNDDSPGVQLLEDCRAIHAEVGGGSISSAELLKHLNGLAGHQNRTAIIVTDLGHAACRRAPSHDPDDGAARTWVRATLEALADAERVAHGLGFFYLRRQHNRSPAVRQSREGQRVSG